MIQLVKFAAWFAVGYVAVMKAAPVVQAKLEAIDLDDAWDIFGAEWE